MQGRVGGQEHVGFEGTVPGESDIHSVNSVGVEVSPVQQRGYDYLAGREIGGGLLKDSPQRVCQSVLLGPEVVGACVDDDEAR